MTIAHTVKSTDFATRIEHDLLGDLEVPVDAYYGIHTLRAVQNFPISGTSIAHHGELVRAMGAVKAAEVTANRDLGLLDSRLAAAIVSACEEIRDGGLHEHFVVDVIQGGAGTSTNMNTNEVVANRALELLGHDRGEYRHLHPLEFADHIKMGRTQLQDAVPMTLGQEFGTYAVMIGEDIARLDEAALLAREINLGGTAIGTGLNSHPDYARRACAALRSITGIDLVTAEDLVEATQDVGAFVQISGTVKRAAVKLSKICNDLRLLSSGPRARLAEIVLPAVQAGSSIMPGKVNPVIPEAVSQVAFEVVGNDIAITMAAEAGQLQLNAFEPGIAHKLLESITHLSEAVDTLATRCVPGITANVDHMRKAVDNSIGLVPALNPHIGYEAATALAARALNSDRTVTELHGNQVYSLARNWT
ncbi:aspartate ammonia-lyase [Rhodococcus jostii]|uniref:Aspartate ammonia-lyase n=1 Tax=Rhodococcus jostii TaxID=132919 RepID=A0A1H5MBC1_RHOJO|nr:aspartate ammonia-lyase [Rhodococcus jostii]